MRIAIFTDEINPSLERAVLLARQWGITHLELRNMPSGRFPAVPDTELDNLRHRLADNGLLVSAVSPGFFKCSRRDPKVKDGLDNGLPRACEWAKALGTDMVLSFAFHKEEEGDPPLQIIDILGQMTDICARHACRLILENEAGCWGGTGEEAAGVIRQLGSDKIRLCWDPGNASHAGSPCPFPDEYDTVKDLVSHVHLKGHDFDTRQWTVLNQGSVDWSGQLKTLADDEYNGFLTIETHTSNSPEDWRQAHADLSDREAATLYNLDFLRKERS